MIGSIFRAWFPVHFMFFSPMVLLTSFLMSRFIRLIYTFYSTFNIPSILISVLCAGIFRISGLSFFVVIFWFKLISMGFIITFTDNYRKKEYYYYQNLGLSKTTLWCSSLIFDFILFLGLIIAAYQLR